MDQETQIAQWIEVGRVAQSARRSRSVRSVAKAAGISEGYVRQIERGYQVVAGQRLPINPSTDKLVALAGALDLDVAEFLALAGRDPSEAQPAQRSSDVAAIIASLHELIDELGRRIL
jgi:transcriptional regulator with XRE-family HTH domain